MKHSSVIPHRKNSAHSNQYYCKNLMNVEDVEKLVSEQGNALQKQKDKSLKVYTKRQKILKYKKCKKSAALYLTYPTRCVF